jgi:hypothetical protein
VLAVVCSGDDAGLARDGAGRDGDAFERFDVRVDLALAMCLCGSYRPTTVCKGIINPLAAICAAQMMLASLGQEKAAEAIEQAVMYATANKLKSLAAGKMGYSTSEVGDLIAAKVAG